MTLISNDLDFEVKRSIHDKNGRFLILDAIINEKEIMLVNLYAPNEQINQIIFFKSIQQMLREFSGQKIIIAMILTACCRHWTREVVDQFLNVSKS